MVPVVSVVVPLQIVLSLVAFLAGTLLPKNFDPSKLSLIIFKLRSKRIVRNLLDIVVGCNTGKLMTSCYILKSGYISVYVWYWKVQYHFKTCSLTIGTERSCKVVQSPVEKIRRMEELHDSESLRERMDLQQNFELRLKTDFYKLWLRLADLMLYYRNTRSCHHHSQCSYHKSHKIVFSDIKYEPSNNRANGCS